MSEQPRKLDLTRAAPAMRPAARLCSATGLTIPECSCRRCVEDQLRRHAPWLLNRDPDTPQPGLGG